MRRPCRANWLIAALVVPLLGGALCTSGVLASVVGESTSLGAAVAPVPRRLADTGLYVAGSTSEVGAGNLPFTPQYPLWSDGATKRRWLSLPPGAAIDASNPNAWEFPRGTRLWKEFTMGRRIETRFIERVADGTWRFATYVWNEQGTDAVLAPEDGLRALAVASAPRGRYTVPGEADCRACHEGAPSPVLGVGALQLSPDRDPLAPHAEVPRAGDLDLRALVDRGWLRNLPQALLAQPPRIAAASANERAVLGYMHGNCSHCHNAAEAGAGVPVSLDLAHDVTDSVVSVERALRSLLDKPSRFRARGAPASAHLVVRGAAESSVLPLRMRSRNPHVQMPPLGTDVPDAEALALLERWINLDLKDRKDSP